MWQSDFFFLKKRAEQRKCIRKPEESRVRAKEEQRRMWRWRLRTQSDLLSKVLLPKNIFDLIVNINKCSQPIATPLSFFAVHWRACSPVWRPGSLMVVRSNLAVPRTALFTTPSAPITSGITAALTPHFSSLFSCQCCFCLELLRPSLLIYFTQ